LKALNGESDFNDDLERVSVDLSATETIFHLLDGYIKSKHKVIDSCFYLRHVRQILDKLHDFLLKYNDFFKILDEKFGTNGTNCGESSKKIIGGMKKEVDQLIILVSQKKFENALESLNSLSKDYDTLKNGFEEIVALPYKIEYSKLSNKDWRMIGLAGVHYRSKVFLSYCFRNDDPKKDENQEMMDYYVKPTLELLNIIPVTSRGYLKPQELIDDRITELIEDCDGIIGFYTKDDSVENIEHELSISRNVIAIFWEEGAKAPSMRRSRLQIKFQRNEMGDFMIGLIKALKEQGLFRLTI
jgi:hypothetical protein